MSSILDALRKVEEEKQAAVQSGGVGFSGEAAERELLGAPVSGSGVLVSPRVFVAGGVVFAAAVVGLSAAVSLSLQRVNSAGPGSGSAAALSLAQSEPQSRGAGGESMAPQPLQIEAVSGGVSQSSLIAQAEPETPSLAPIRVAVIPNSDMSAAPPPDAAPVAPRRPSAAEVAEMRVEAARVRREREAREREAREREAVAARVDGVGAGNEASFVEARPVRRDIEPVNVRSLPVMSPLEKERYGLGRVQINMVSVATDRRPIPSAVINLKAIHVGELIPGTSARLIGVDTGGVGIELESTGRRYLLPF